MKMIGDILNFQNWDEKARVFQQLNSFLLSKIVTHSKLKKTIILTPPSKNEYIWATPFKGINSNRMINN